MLTISTSKDIDVDKYSNALLYFIANCNNKYLGSTKLNKLMYYFDFISYRDRSKPVSGDTYLHLEFGPVPQEVDKVLALLKKNNAINVQDVPFKDGHKDEYKAIVESDTTVFDEYELRLLDAICEEFELWDTPKIVEQTHLEAPWFYSEPLAQVDYAYANDIDFFTELEHVSSPSR